MGFIEDDGGLQNFEKMMEKELPTLLLCS
jgi:hypothetical protein